jgi:cell division protein FtsQ
MSSAVRGPNAEVRRAHRRFARRQWARRWLTWRPLLAGLAAVTLAGGLAWLVFFSSVLAVTGVTVEGNGLLAAGEVRRAAAVPTGTPLARVDLGAVASRVEDLAPVAGVDVSRSWPDTVRIAVTERESIAVVERGGRLHGMDADGVLFREYRTRPAGLPVVRIGSRTAADAVAEAARVVSALPAEVLAKVEYVEAATRDEISLRLRNGRTVRWGSAADTDDKAAVLAVLLRQKAVLYDVTVPGRPVIRR